MLMSLCIEQFAIVDKLELDFASGMTAFTGETGAGKSIMIDALMLALGERADASVIRSGAEKCDIQAVFTLSDDAAPLAWLSEHDIELKEGELILRRILFREGRSKSYINGIAFPLQKVKALSELLVDIHGQHQHQSLLHHATHRVQLDHYANHPQLLGQVEACYRRCHELERQLKTWRDPSIQRERVALLQFQQEELAALNLQQGEIEVLHKEHQLLHHAKDYLIAANHALNLLEEAEPFNLRQALNQVMHDLHQLPTEETSIQNASEVIQNALIQCEEAVSELRAFIHQVPLNPQRLSEVESRMSALHQAARKYQVEVSDLYAHAEQIQTELTALEQGAQEKERLEHDYVEACQAYQKAALALRSSRQKHALQLSQDITEVIQQLGMPKGSVQIDISPLEHMHSHGQDKVEYLVCTNPGMPRDSLAKIASGGELSRISLGIQMIAARRGSTPTLIFDEVDVGIGGATAALVGQLLRQLGERLQVFCVTHQPQVASSAHHHLVVEKEVDEYHTYSRVHAVQKEARIEEIARMLGGLTITAQTRLNAKELLEL